MLDGSKLSKLVLICQPKVHTSSPPKNETTTVDVAATKGIAIRSEVGVSFSWCEHPIDTSSASDIPPRVKALPTLFAGRAATLHSDVVSRVPSRGPDVDFKS